MSNIIGLDFDDVIVDTEAFKTYNLSLSKAEQFPIYESKEQSLERLKFREGALEGLNKLSQLGFDLIIITARSGLGLEIATTILQRANLSIPIIGVGHRNSKAPYVEGFKAFIDDDPRNLMDMIGVVPNLFLMSTEENSYDVIPEWIVRIESWKVFVDIMTTEQ